MNTNILKLLISILLCQGAGFVGSFANRTSVDTWYSTIKKPGFNPPNWIFGPVWIVLFVMMAVALYLVWISGTGTGNKNLAITVFMVQLGLNILWSYLFFYFKSPGWGVVEIIVLWIFILITILLFLPVSRWAGYLMIPYFLWVTFASVLNFSIWHLNR